MQRAIDESYSAKTVDSGKTVNVERFGTGTTLPLLILLHGVNGPSPFYREQAAFFAAHGYRVVLPHYMEAGHGQAATDENYEAWTAAVRRTMDDSRGVSPAATVVVGYSLGASVALALGSEGRGPDAIAEFYGSLPDSYFRDLKGMPPLLILHGDQDRNIRCTTRFNFQGCARRRDSSARCTSIRRRDTDSLRRIFEMRMSGRCDSFRRLWEYGGGQCCSGVAKVGWRFANITSVSVLDL